MKDQSLFLAICKDKPEDPDGFYYTVYLVNNSATTLTNVRMETYGYCTMDDELVTTSTYTENFGELAPFSALEIENDDDGTFDFVILFTFEYDLNGAAKKHTFQIDKYMKGGVKPLSPLPVLNKFGQMFYEK